MQAPRISIASLFVLTAIVALDCTWYRYSYVGSKSIFGFGIAPAFDTGGPADGERGRHVVLPAPRGQAAGRPLGDRFRGSAAWQSIVAFLVLGWTWPDGVRLWLRPIYPAWKYRSSAPMTSAYLYLADIACFLPVQVFLATIGGSLMLAISRRSRRIGPSRAEVESRPDPEVDPGGA